MVISIHAGADPENFLGGGQNTCIFDRAGQAGQECVGQAEVAQKQKPA